ncbi:ArsR/SmtB family transcription factor [Nocardioides currus]|uniref:ArsR/SmtB family transcription factor n=1 Tax=Nocardioides currus TaxID=2133958 RepID=UPI001FB02C99|nr:metalloregulator ArsR/SmtB family transcription factor [Nocardioides currus]
MAHEPTRHRLPPDLDVETAVSVASTLQALAHAGRLRILATLQAGPATVGRLTESLAMEQSALSHQLRLLRDLGFVTAERQGRHVEYRLFDNHIGELIEQALSHAEHVRLGVAERDAASVDGGVGASRV